MVVVEWNNTTDLSTAVNANKATTEDVTFKLTEDYTAHWDAVNWSGFSTAGLTLIIDLNGFEIKPATIDQWGSIGGAALFDFHDGATPNSPDVYLGYIYSGGMKIGHPNQAASSFNGNIIVENGTIDISHFGQLGSYRHAVLMCNYSTATHFSATFTFLKLTSHNLSVLVFIKLRSTPAASDSTINNVRLSLGSPLLPVLATQIK